MGKVKQAYMAVTEDDMMDCIEEIKIFNRFMEGVDIDEVAPPEGFSEGCSE